MRFSTSWLFPTLLPAAFAAALGGAHAAAPAAPPKPSPTPLIEEIKALSAGLAQGRACSWLLRFDEIALGAKMLDDASRVRLGFGKQSGDAADAAVKAAASTAPCNGPSDVQRQTQVALVRLEWLARADALYTTSEGTAFGKGMTRLGGSHPLRRREFERMRDAYRKNRGEPAWQAFYAVILDDARIAVDLACADRAKFGVKQARKCPVIKADEKKYIPMAVQQLRSAEDFSAAYTEAARAVAATSVAESADRSKLWKALKAGTQASLFGGVPCGIGDKVVEFNGPRANRGRDRSGKVVVIAPVIAFGNPAELGTVTVAPDGPDYILLNADKKASDAGVAGSIIFKRCAAV